MTVEDPSKLFNAHYYAHNCGRPYQRDEEWLRFFGGIAERIVQDIQPQTVLDAGCAMGFLVEMLRRKGTEAYGVDISEYAIENVNNEIKSFCWVGSITEPFSRKYDLIVSIEVLEHMNATDAEKAIENICQHTDNVLFSSTPFDYQEATHFNVQPPEVWAELFARQGFYRDVDFDASFLTPWAVRFRKRDEPIHRLIREYERRFWLLWKENTDLRSLVGDMRDQITEVDLEVQEKEKLIHSLETQRNEIINSKGWMLLQSIHRLQRRLIGKR